MGAQRHFRENTAIKKCLAVFEGLSCRFERAYVSDYAHGILQPLGGLLPYAGCYSLWLRCYRPHRSRGSVGCKKRKILGVHSPPRDGSREHREDPENYLINYVDSRAHNLSSNKINISLKKMIL